MPEIEVTLDEIKGTTLKTQADVDRLMRDFSKPETKRDVLSGLPGGATGFLDNIIKGLTSKGIMGGLAAGGAAGGILVLSDAIKALTKQSKVLTTVQDTVGKALGLLVDLVLLPFLPLLVFGLLYLYTAIMWVGKIWNDWIAKSSVVEAAGNVFNPGDKTALERTIDFVSLMNDLAKAWFDGMTRIILGVGVFFAELVIGVAKFIIELIANIGQALGEGWLKFQEWIVQKVKDLVVALSEAWAKFATGLDANLITPIKNALNVIRDKIVDMINFVINKINDFLPSGMKISTIPTAQSEFEAKWNAARAAENGGANRTGADRTFNFYGLTMPELENKVREINREDGARLNV